MQQIIKELQEFADKHGVQFVTDGECGFGRPCVGLLKDECYIAHNPLHAVTYEVIEGFEDERLRPPYAVPDAYHKHDCLAVLKKGEEEEHANEALRQLHAWIKHLESLGEVVIEEYQTGATGMQAVFTGRTGWAVRIK